MRDRVKLLGENNEFVNKNKKKNIKIKFMSESTSIRQ